MRRRALRSLWVSLAMVQVGATLAAGHGGGMIGQGSPARIHQEVVEIFGETAAFSATAMLTTTKTSGEFVQRFGYRLRNGTLRLDYTSEGDPFLTAAQKQSRRERGTDTWYQIIRADRSLLAFPERKAYTVLPDVGAPPERIERTTLGPADLDGVRCVKDRFVIESDGDTIDMIVWRPAGDPAAIPLRIESDHGDTTTRLEFQNVTRGAPDASLFEAPAGFERHADMQALTEALR